MIVGARAWHASLAWGGASAGIAFPLLGPPPVWCYSRSCGACGARGLSPRVLIIARLLCNHGC